MKKKLYPLFIGLFLAQCVMAQAPGGVSAALTMWIKSNAGVTQSSGQISSWTYANDGSKSFAATAGSMPNFTTNAINFLPAAGFTTTQFMDGPTGTDAPITAGNPAYTAFVVWESNINNDYQRLWQQRDNSCSFCNDAFAISTWNNGEYGDETGTNPFAFGMPQPYTVNTWHISEIQLLNQPTGDLEITDETNYLAGPVIVNTDQSATPDGPANRSISDQVNRLGLNYDGTTGLNGALAEVIVYNGSLTSTQSASVFSYLALKYGITLGGNIQSSAGTTLWDATADASYNNQVFGIGTDNSSGLSITQANSNLTGNGDGTGISGMGNVILSNASLSTDQSFLFAGNDLGSLAESTTGAPSSLSGITIFGRKWKVKHTGNVGTVDVSIDYNGLAHNGTPGDASTFRMLVDPTGAGDFSTSPTVYTPTGFSGTEVQYSGVTLADGSTFTFGSSPVPLPVTWTAFTANVINQTDISLNWTIANNQNAKNYVVEHSDDGQSFSPVGDVANIASVKSYSYLYPNATPGTHYFRVHETDLDGKDIYSKIVSATIKEGALNLRLISNPIIGDQVDMELTAAAPTQAYISIFSANGGRMLTQVQSLQTGSNRSQLPVSNLPAGNYILEVRTATTTLHQTFVKL